MTIPRLPVHDPGLASLRSAVRAAIVMPAVFAIADKVIQDPQIATADEISASPEDVAGELPQDEFDRAADAEPSEHAEA